MQVWFSLILGWSVLDNGIFYPGIDVCLGELGEIIQETMESYEIELNGKTHKSR